MFLFANGGNWRSVSFKTDIKKIDKIYIWEEDLIIRTILNIKIIHKGGFINTSWKIKNINNGRLFRDTAIAVVKRSNDSSHWFWLKKTLLND